MATIDATITIRSGIMTLVFRNMTLNIKIFSNMRLEDFDEKEEASCIKVVIKQSLELICQKDPVEFALNSSVIDCGCYNS